MGPDRASPAVLVTMPHSHYAEKARWALDRVGFPYREEPHIPLFHRIATRRHGGGSVPVLACGDERLVDSTQILAHADAACGGGLYPDRADLRREVESLEERFDEGLGPHTRRWAYSLLLPETRLLRRAMSRGVPRLEAVMLPALMPAILKLIRSALRITPESAARSLQRVRGIFAEVDGRLADGRRYLVGDRFSAADLTFAALAAPVIFPEGYRASYLAFDEAPAAMREEALRLRDGAAGRFALRLYAEERDRALAPRGKGGT